MDVEKIFRGHAVCTVIETLLTDAGYHVVPFGIERIIRELRPLSYEDYVGMTEKLGKIRKLPDLMVLDLDKKEAWPVEVKYRSKLTKEFSDEMGKIEWKPFYLILSVTSEKPWGTSLIDHIRVFKIEDEDKVSLDFFKNKDNARRIQDIFPRLSKKYPEKTIKKAEDLILKIAGES